MNGPTTQIKIETIDKVIAMYPALKKDRDHIIETIIGKQKTDVVNFVVEKFEHMGKSYYRECNKYFGAIVDAQTNLVGTYERNKDGSYIYHFFDETKKITNNLKNQIISA